jgi:hypothetical protein
MTGGQVSGVRDQVKIAEHEPWTGFTRFAGLTRFVGWRALEAGTGSAVDDALPDPDP